MSKSKKQFTRLTKEQLIKLETLHDNGLSTTSHVGMLLEHIKAMVEPKAEPDKELIAQAEAVYQEYPRKTGKGGSKGAIAAIIRALKNGHSAPFLTERVKAYASAVKGKDLKYIPIPSTFFNQGRYNDDISSAAPSDGKADLIKQRAEVQHAINNHIANPQYFLWNGRHSYESGQEYEGLKQKLKELNERIT